MRAPMRRRKPHRRRGMLSNEIRVVDHDLDGRAVASAALVLGGVLEQLLSAPPEVDVRQDGLRLEDDPVVVRAHLRPVELLGKVRHVVAETEEVLLVLSLSPTLQVTSIWFDWSSTEHSPSIDSR